MVGGASGIAPMKLGPLPGIGTWGRNLDLYLGRISFHKGRVYPFFFGNITNSPFFCQMGPTSERFAENPWNMLFCNQ